MKVFEHADTLCCMRQLAVVREAVLEAIFIVIRLALAQAPRNHAAGGHVARDVTTTADFLLRVEALEKTGKTFGEKIRQG